MERIDIDRAIAAKFAFEEAMNAAFHGSHERLTETSISLPTVNELRKVQDATGVIMTVGAKDSSDNPVTREVVYNGCHFWCHIEDFIFEKH